MTRFLLVGVVLSILSLIVVLYSTSGTSIDIPNFRPVIQQVPSIQTPERDPIELLVDQVSSNSTSSSDSVATFHDETTDSKDLRRRVVASTALEVLKGVSCDTILELSNAINLSDLGDEEISTQFCRYSKWEGLTIRNVQRFTLQGAHGSLTSLVTDRPDDVVLKFHDSSDVVLRYLNMGHNVPQDGCQEGVLSATAVSNLHVMECVLFGSGFNGISAYDSNGLRIEKSIIKECSQNAAVFRSCDNVMFLHSSIIDNTACYLFDFESTKAVLNACVIRSNREREVDDRRSYLVRAQDRSNIRITGSSISLNDYDESSISDESQVVFDASEVFGNKFDRPK